MKAIWIVITVAALAVAGCDLGGVRTLSNDAAAGTTYFNMFINTALFPTSQGSSLKLQLGKANGQIFLQTGKATIKGTLKDASGTGANVANTIQITLTHRSSGGQVLETWSVNARVNADGTIPLQSSPFPGFVLQPQQTLQFSAKPVDRDLPFSQLKVRVKLIAI